MFNNDIITLFNIYTEDGEQKYKRTYLDGVDWQCKTSTKLTEKGLLTDDSIQIFIPYSESYLKPKTFARTTDKSDYFTFKAGDIIVKGKIDFELTGKAPNNIKYLENYYDDVITIISILECDLTEHWEVGAK